MNTVKFYVLPHTHRHSQCPRVDTSLANDKFLKSFGFSVNENVMEDHQVLKLRFSLSPCSFPSLPFPLSLYLSNKFHLKIIEEYSFVNLLTLSTKFGNYI